jgi:hypothetical protein
LIRFIKFITMKKTVFAILFFACAPLAYGQSIVPRLGLTLSTVKADSEEDAEPKSTIGFTVGAGFNIPVNEMFSVQPELNFIQKGFKIEESYSEDLDGYVYKEETEVKLTVNYLELPVLAKFSFGTDTKFFFVAGPSLGFGLGGKAKIDYSYSETYNGQTDSESLSVNGKIKFGDEPDESEEDEIYFDNRIDFGAQLGVGVLIKNRIAVEARYGLGLSSLDGDEDVMNRVFQFSVAMPISLVK